MNNTQIVELRSSGRQTQQRARPATARQSGYALLMIMFFTALLLISTMVAAPRLVTEGKREKEAEMVWRGKQYVRGVKMYYRKMGRFPTSIDDLTKPKVGSLRFMRQAYKDPMNPEDGSWRLIYVGAAGQLIGSLKPPRTLQLPGAGPGLGASASSVATNSAGQQGQQSGFGSSTFGQSGGGTNGSSFGNSSFGNSGSNGTPPGGAPQGGQPSAIGQPGAQPGPEGAPAAGTDASGAAIPSDAMSTPQPITPAETTQVIGGNIIGVGSKKIAPSLLVYDKAKNYHLFEFIWDPSKDTTVAGAPPVGNGLGVNPGANGNAFGLTPGNNSSFGQQPTANPGQAAAPNPNAPQNNNGGPPLDGAAPPTPQPQN